MTEPNQPDQPQPTYIGEHVQIGGGFGGMKPLAQNGKVVIVGGYLQLIGSQGQLIDQAPVGQVTFASSKVAMGGAQWLSWGEKKYSIAIGAGGMMLLGGIMRLFVGSKNGKRLKAALAEEQQRYAGTAG